MTRTTCWISALVLAVAGCGAKESRVEIEAAAHDAPARAEWPLIPVAEPCEAVAADFGVDASAFATVGIRWLDEKATRGRFPTGIAVASFDVRCGNDTQRGRSIVPRPLPPEQAAVWNQLLDSLAPVREVTICDARGTTPDAKSLEQIVREAGDLKCAYCLVYSAWGDGIGEQRIVSVLYETQPPRAVAAITAESQVPAPLYQYGLKQRPQDERKYRADYRAMRQFQSQVHRAAAALLGRDQPAAATQQSPWQTDRPLYPRDPRRRYGEAEYP